MTETMDGASRRLERTMRPEWVFAMALGSAVGWGAFILPFDWLGTGGLAGTILGFLIGGGMIAIIAVSYGLVIRALPVTGGGLAYALSSLGRTHGFIAGWCLTLGYAGIIALNASAVALVFRVTVPNFAMQGRLYTVAGWDVYIVEVIISSLSLLLFAWINYRGMKASGFFQFFAVVLILIAVALILAACALFFFIARPPLAPMFPPDTAAWSAIAAIVAIAPWAYVGFDTVPQLAGEFKFSARRALNLLMWGITAATFIYIAMSVSTAIAVGTERESYANAAWPPAVAIADTIGTLGLILMVIAVSMGVLTGLNGFYASISRVILTMGRAKMMPQMVTHLSPKTSTPTVAIILTTLVCLITPWFGRAALSWVVDMTSAGITVAYFYTCYCSYKIGRTGHVMGMKASQEPNNTQNVFGIIGCSVAVMFFALLFIPGSPGALGRESLIALLAWAILGIIFYSLRRKELMSTSKEYLMRTVYS